MLSLTVRDERHLKTLYPPFARQVRRWLVRCHEEELPVHLTQSFRFYGEQQILFQSGRSRANAGESFHNFCVAIDFCFDNDSDKPGVQAPYVEPFQGAWRRAAELAQECDMIAGYFWDDPDRPHIQAKIKTPVHELHRIFIKKDMVGLFDYLDEHEKLA